MSRKSPAETAFVSGPLALKSGVSLWLDTGTTLFASHDPRDFDSSPGKCAGNNTGRGPIDFAAGWRRPIERE